MDSKSYETWAKASSEKELLPQTVLQKDRTQPSGVHRRTRHLLPRLTLVGLVGLLGFGWVAKDHLSSVVAAIPCASRYTEHRTAPASCPQQEPLVPSSPIVKAVDHYYNHPSFKSRAVTWLSGAVQVPTESYDDLGPVGEDKRWESFGEFHKYLERAFPKTWSSLKVTKVNTYALSLHWQGSDSALKPILLAAHQDVVPVNAKAEPWTHPPYAGHFDGERIWGRGSSDDKSGLIGILSSFETLLGHGFVPKRTVVTAFGIDEEAGGLQGAGRLAEYLETEYGKDGFAFVVDEGGGIVERWGTLVAAPSIAEKGYLDVRVQISTAGGHSSVPPKHTSIGLVAPAITLIEDHPHAPELSRASPFYSSLICFAEHIPALDEDLRNGIKKSLKSDKALDSLKKTLTESEDNGKMLSALLSTTLAVDLVEGGVKVNALPERASAVVNHRISTDSSVKELVSYLTELLTPFAEEYNLAFTSFGANVSSVNAHPAGRLEIFDAFSSALDPAPISPTDAPEYALLSGTILGTYSTAIVDASLEAKKDMIVAPAFPTGNTDTKFYWNLTKNIYRYNHKNVADSQNAHTVNEALRASALIDAIRFFTYLILNADESTAI